MCLPAAESAENPRFGASLGVRDEVQEAEGGDEAEIIAPVMPATPEAATAMQTTARITRPARSIATSSEGGRPPLGLLDAT